MFKHFLPFGRWGNIDEGQYVPSQTAVGLLGEEPLRHMKRASPGRAACLSPPLSLSLEAELPMGTRLITTAAGADSTLPLHLHSSRLSLKKPSLRMAQIWRTSSIRWHFLLRSDHGKNPQSKDDHDKAPHFSCLQRTSVAVRGRKWEKTFIFP